MANELTPQQVQQLAQDAARDAVKCYQRRALAGFVTLVVGLGLAFFTQSQEAEDRERADAAQQTAIVDSTNGVAVESCNRDFRSSLQVVAILDTYGVPQEFYPLPDCREVDQRVTKNPERAVRKAKPYYEGAPYAPDHLELPKGGE